jgi:hypothetical protein
MKANPLYFTGCDGKNHSSYVIDLSGRLICRSSEGVSEQPIKYAIDLPEYQIGQDMPLNWELTPDDIEEKIRNYSNYSSGIKNILSKLYPSGKVKRVKHVFFPTPTCDKEIDDSDVLAAINKIESSDNALDSLEKALVSVGVFEIPVLLDYSETYHEIEGGLLTDGFSTVKNGWASSSKVYRKSVITAAQKKS